jgi:hypothetical protein
VSPASRPRRCGAVFDGAPASFTGPFARLVHCQLLRSSPHTTHFASPPHSGDTRYVIWWSGSVFVIAAPYKRPYEYKPGVFPPGDWIIANFVNTPDCNGSVAPDGDCDSCDRCSLFASWRRGNSVDEFDDFDVSGQNPMFLSDKEREHLGDPICGLCGGFV